MTNLTIWPQRVGSSRRVTKLQVFCAIDYQIATPGIAALARQAGVYKDARFSDHAPLTVDYDLDL